MNHPNSISTKLDVLGVNLWVIEVKKFNFEVSFEKYSLKTKRIFEEKGCQQLPFVPVKLSAVVE